MTSRARALFMLAMILSSTPVTACTSYDVHPIDAPLAPIDDLFQRLSRPLDPIDGPMPPKEMRFLYPFLLARPVEIAELWRETYEGGYIAPAVDGPERLNHMLSSLLEGAPLAALGDARAIAERVLDMPVTQADANQEELRRAVELIELQPHLKEIDSALVYRFFSKDPSLDDPGVELPPVLAEARQIHHLQRSEMGEYAARHPESPRVASLRFVALQETMRHDIPDGWPAYIARALTPDDWKRFEALHDSWLADFPGHPLADLVRLSKVRLAYLQHGRGMWDILLDLYPRHRPRLLAEMRFLSDSMPPGALSHPHADPVLKSALIHWTPLDPDQWTSLWKLSEAHAAEAWAINLQERLLDLAASRFDAWKKLPPGFPERPANPTALWGRLRLIVLYKAERWDKFEEQDKTLPADETLAALRARVLLKHGDLLRATQVAGLDAQARGYLVRVMLDDKALAALSQSPDPGLHNEILLTQAVRRAGHGDWKAGSELLRAALPEKAALWDEAARRAADGSPKGRLAWARFLRDNRGKLFFGVDKSWEVSVCWRGTSIVQGSKQAATDLPWTNETESASVRDYLTSSSETYLALQAYAAALSAADPKGGDSEAVLKEADAVYNSLINWPYANFSCFRDYLKDSEAAVTLRRVGRQIRGT